MPGCAVHDPIPVYVEILRYVEELPECHILILPGSGSLPEYSPVRSDRGCIYSRPLPVGIIEGALQ
jgi:hypothetical protein